MSAFHGDPAIQAALLTRIDQALATNALSFGVTRWDAATVQGSALGISVEGTNAEHYAERFGYPLALASLLDPLAERMAGEPIAAGAFIRRWVADVAPGAPLGRAAARLLLWMLETPDVGMDDDPLGRTSIALHRQWLTDDPPSPKDWFALREQILDAEVPLHDFRRKARLALCEAASWPVDQGGSVLVEAMRYWLDFAALEPDADWSDEDERQKEATLAQLWNEQSDARAAGQPVSYPDLFAAVAPDLETRFRAHLTRTTARLPRRAALLGEQCLTLLGAAHAASPAPTGLDLR
ncbi:MAG: hypothetical protein PGN16_01915 [Sphingomonas phyllosphaerae]|uniref:hypothetical protein n=1 Tax=Sphingomonas phyllosphaerae TaxID=257003 RepID=UPI002FF87795